MFNLIEGTVGLGIGLMDRLAFRRFSDAILCDLQTKIDNAKKPSLLSESTAGTVVTYTVTYAKGTPQRAFVIAENERGRVLARLRNGDTQTLDALLSADPIGKTWSVTHADGVNYIGDV